MIHFSLIYFSSLYFWCAIALFCVSTVLVVKKRGGTFRPRELLVGGYHSEVMLQPGIQETPDAEIPEKRKSRSDKATAEFVPERRREETVRLERRNCTEPTDTGCTRVLIVGAGSVGRTLARSLQSGKKHFVVGFVDDDEGNDHLRHLRRDWKVLGSRDEVERIVKELRVDEVILAYAPTWQHTLVENLSAKHPEVSLRVVPSYYDALMRLTEIECHNDIALIRLTQSSRMARDLVKRTFDILVAVFGLILSSPFLLVSVLLIKASSQGSPIFAQQRIGWHGEPFTLYKLRTMVADAERKSGPVLATGTRDSRLTPVGKYLRKFRLDEIPQLWNVLRGEMSLVGPRPERPFFVQQFTKKTPSYAHRHQVRPGITGLAQVCGGYHTDARDKLRFDLIYVSYNSLWLDFTILWKTVSVIVIPQKSGLDK